MYKKARLIYLQTVALALLLVLVSLLFTGLTQGERVATQALTHLGKEYVLGQRGPDRFDCSGLVLYCADLEGVKDLPHSAEQLYTLGLPLQTWQLLPGDMLCFDTVSDRDPSDHVGIWLGGNQFVHASSAKHQVVVSDFEGYYKERFTGARRLVNPFI